jgi:N-acetylglucosaminyl-diphospho-decaprenol L-rhamnosyltransferase
LPVTTERTDYFLSNLPAAPAAVTDDAEDEASALRDTSQVLQVAVIIVTYKSAQFTIEALRALCAERSDPLLLIRAEVIDNASGDLPAIAQAVEQFNWSSWVTLVAAPVNGGFAYGNNLGVESAFKSGDPSYIYLLNPDTKVRPGAIGSLVQFLESHAEAGIAGSGVEDSNGHDWPIAFRFPSLMGELIQGVNLGFVTKMLQSWATVRYMPRANDSVDWVSGASMMIRAAVFKAIGGLDENYFLFFEETDFCRRARRAGYSTWYVPESRVMHIGGQSTALPPNSPERKPAYWFESRRRYFAVTFGIICAMVIDLVSMAAHAFGVMKRRIRRQGQSNVPYFIRDLMRHSILRKRNRNVQPFRSRISGYKD